MCHSYENTRYPYQIFNFKKIYIRLGSSGFVEYIPGNTGIIIAVPHGGSLAANNVPNRVYGTFEEDDYTKELGEVVRQSICGNLGQCPHLVVSKLKRIKLDPNRNITEAAQGDPHAEQAWREYHGFIDWAKQNRDSEVVIDLHGQSHLQNSTELGYLLSSEDLNKGSFDSESSSIRSLASKSGKSGKDLITGKESLGYYLEQLGYNAFPSPRQPSPGSQEYFPGNTSNIRNIVLVTPFQGNYTVRRHGYESCTFDSISVETPREVRIDAGRESRIKFGEALGKAISEFFKSNYL